LAHAIQMPMGPLLGENNMRILKCNHGEGESCMKKL
jgi:hypothetical protein